MLCSELYFAQTLIAVDSFFLNCSTSSFFILLFPFLFPISFAPKINHNNFFYHIDYSIIIELNCKYYMPNNKLKKKKRILIILQFKVKRKPFEQLIYTTVLSIKFFFFCFSFVNHHFYLSVYLLVLQVKTIN